MNSQELRIFVQTQFSTILAKELSLDEIGIVADHVRQSTKNSDQNEVPSLVKIRIHHHWWGILTGRTLISDIQSQYHATMEMPKVIDITPPSVTVPTTFGDRLRQALHNAGGCKLTQYNSLYRAFAKQQTERPLKIFISDEHLRRLNEGMFFLGDPCYDVVMARGILVKITGNSDFSDPEIVSDYDIQPYVFHAEKMCQNLQASNSDTTLSINNIGGYST